MNLDLNKPRHEVVRWVLLLTLNNGRPSQVPISWMVDVVRSSLYPDATVLEVQRELDYLESRRLVSIQGRHSGAWVAEIERYGIDVVEYTVECGPGIARPAKYW